MFSLESLNTTGFDWHCALSLAMASDLAYQPAAAVTSLALNAWGFDRCVFLDRDDTQGFVAHSEHVVLVAFRGTESLGDWLADLNLLWTARPYGELHRGFYNAYADVSAALRQAIDAGGVGNRKIWITGHSLGGALTTVAAAELRGGYPITGCHTFGQPRLADRDFQQAVAQWYPQSFFRFVNDDDLVTRVPPGFRHVGRLLHFDRHGRLHTADPEAAIESATGESASEPPMMSEPEFRRMQEEIRTVQAEAAAVAAVNPAVEREALVDRSVEGLFPSVGDHSLNRYIAAIRRYVDLTTPEGQLPASGLDPVVEMAQQVRQGALAIESAAVPRALGGHETDRLPILIRVREGQWQPPEGVEVHSQVGFVCSARATADQIDLLRRAPGVVSIESSREAGLPECSVSVPFVGGATVHAPPIDERGDSALVGVIDTGVDILHEAFQDAAGASRIVMLWNQKDPTGPTPREISSTRFQPDYGTVYQAAELQALLDGDADNVPLVLRDPHGHGTHVASIAAGRQVGTFGGGMAPEAKLVVVIPHMETDPGDPPSLGYSNSHVDALSFLKDYAEHAGLPMAVNVSLGMNAGAHDGLSNLEAAFDSITGNGRDPGFVIVKSAGNERGFAGHAQVQVFPGLTQIKWTSSSAFRMQDYIEVWSSSADELAFTLIDPQGNRSEQVSLANPAVNVPLGGNFCRLKLVQYHPDNGDTRLTLQIFPQGSPIQQGEWILEILGEEVRSRDGRVDAWVERDDGSRAVRFTTGDNDAVILSIPGTAATVITVAACHAADPLRLTDRSSFGPTRTGMPKPDLCAPGNEIAAAGGNTVNSQAVATMTGTSMAAPHVTGALALCLSRRHKQAGQPQFNARQLQRALVNSARRSSHLHHPGFGFGLLDTVSLFAELP
jgi:endonuclease G